MLQPSKFQNAEYARATYVATVDVPFEHTLEPEFWTHVAANVRVGDRIEVYAADRSFYAELMVRAQHRLALKVAPIIHAKFDQDVSPEVHSEYKIEHRGPIAMFSVIRKSDGSVMNEGFQDQKDALRALNRLEQEIAQ